MASFAWRSRRTSVRRKRYAKKRAAPRKRSYKRSLRPTKVFKISRYIPTTLTTITTPTTTIYTNAYGAASFQFSDIPDLSSFNTLFDEYRLDMVEVRFRSVNNPSNLNTPGETGQHNIAFSPTLYYYTDHDDSVPPTSVNQMKEYYGCKQRVLKPMQWVTVKLRPVTLTQLYLTSIATGYAVNKRPVTIDMAQTNVPHYGLKWAIDFMGLSNTSPVTQTFYYEIEAKYHVSLMRCK